MTVRSAAVLRCLASVVLLTLTLLTVRSATPLTSFTLVRLAASVSGSEVSASATVAASTTTAVDAYGVCVRSSSGQDEDFDKPPATITTEGTSSGLQTKAFAPGTYTYYACLRGAHGWQPVGRWRSFTVSPAAPAAPTPLEAPESPAGTPGATPRPPGAAPDPKAAMPTKDLPGWTLTYSEDFRRPARRGQIGRVYGQSMRGYDAVYDTTGNGLYAPDRVLSVRDGVLRYDLRTEDDQPLSAAPLPIGWKGQTFGRYSVRFKTNVAPGYKLSFLLWPASDNWDEGEIDFPEGPLGQRMYGASAIKGTLERRKVIFDAGQAYTPTTTTDWHVATTEWSPGLVRWLWDGVEFGRTRTASGVPTRGMVWVLQAETSSYGIYPDADTVGRVEVDWLAAYRYDR